MTDQAADFAKFLIEEYRGMPPATAVIQIKHRFPHITYGEFMRGFAIAEELAIADASTTPHHL
ncbi:hypothetical protein [Brucella intermedia]|uniref:hypothetical protein n=1 Tax=Brucella intermedia TaxID=94625 RepID=UPI00224B2292|nr:hypothetical protein [Brucella intermedia]